ncbi:ParB-like nuclease domain-containing protein [Tianweitania sp. BSSL-BM11]|uniref:ParB-like nuclease domain-containing protein n=1 Tax=Tianweitania aestuarii TaxID=2814886 RepID=A0ABS5RY24_9HYPH|nr:ParB/RepB/Spo0J family partition protein [Tianweitania aestuarii]MBS9721944.1 ParB-like nuclease domain-containing protein [Tianweitania aestuarii]
MSIGRGLSRGTASEKDRLEREAQAGTREDRPTVLRLRDIHTCPPVFQPRLGEDRNGATNGDHVRALVHQLDTMPAGARKLEPIAVYAAGRRFYIVDGHHRRAAYEKAGITEGIPVRHFEGTLEAAIHAALEFNSRAHLGLTNAERNEAAWRLVCIGEMKRPRITVAAIVQASRLSKKSVENMRALWRRLQARFGDNCDITGERLPAVFDTYREAVEADRGEKKEFTKEMRDAMIGQMVDKLGKALGKHPHQHPEMMGEALVRYLGEVRFASMVEEQGFMKVELEELEEFRAWKDRGAINPHVLHPAKCGFGDAGHDYRTDPSDF